MVTVDNSGIKDLGNNRWKIRVQPVDPSTGNRVSKVKTIIAKNEFEAMKAKIILEDYWIKKLSSDASDPNLKQNVQILKNMKESKDTVEEYCSFWFTHPSGSQRKHVQDKNREHFEAFVFPILGNKRISFLNRQDIVYWMEEVQKLKNKRTGQPYARKTLQQQWAVLRACINQAYYDGKMPNKICEGFRFSPKGQKPKERENLEPEEVERFLTVVNSLSIDVKAMIYLNLTTGCRFGELSALTWNDLDLTKKKMKITKSQCNQDVNEPKTGKVKTVNLMQMVVDLLSQWKKEQTDKPNRYPTFKNFEGFKVVFPSKTGVSYREQAMLYKVLQKCVEAADIRNDSGELKKIGSHSLRRSFINLTREAGTERVVIKAMVGHSTNLMFEHYSKVRQVEQAKAQENAFKGLIPVQNKNGRHC